MPCEAVIRPTRVEIDLDALRHNARLLGQLAGTAVYAVVKADAYGHGAEQVARALAASGHVAGFAVSLVEEGTRLRDAGVGLPILVMGPALDRGYDELIGRNMTAVVSDFHDLQGLAQMAARAGRLVDIHIKVDTGMGRLGFLPEHLPAVVQLVQSMGHVHIAGVSTHFACADSDDPDDPECMTHEQLRCFDSAVATLRGHGVGPMVAHTANSAATLRFPQTRRDLVRCGIALYGNGVQPGTDRSAKLCQAMRLVTHIAQIREVRKGSTVSYGALWRAPDDARLAILPVGYADGVARRVTGRAEVLIAGRRCPLVGAVSMDIAIADLTSLDRPVEIGDEVVLLGTQEKEHISVREFAEWAGVTEYEVTCGMSVRVPRMHLAQETE